LQTAVREWKLRLWFGQGGWIRGWITVEVIFLRTVVWHIRVLGGGIGVDVCGLALGRIRAGEAPELVR